MAQYGSNRRFNRREQVLIQHLKRKIGNSASSTGLPTGGTNNQVLKKDSATDFDASWASISGGDGISASGIALAVDLSAAASMEFSTGALQLTNDNATPGNSYYYGTNGAGTKGWYAASTIGSTTWLGLTDTPGSFTANAMYAANAAGTALVLTPLYYIAATPEMYIGPGVDLYMEGGDFTIEAGHTTVIDGQVKASDTYSAASAPAYAFFNGTAMGMYRAAANTLGFSTNSSEVLRMFSDQNVSIGSTTNVAPLYVAGIANNTLVLGDDTTPPRDGILKVVNDSATPMSGGRSLIAGEKFAELGNTTNEVMTMRQTVANTGTPSGSPAVGSVFSLVHTDNDTTSTNVQITRVINELLTLPSSVKGSRTYICQDTTLSGNFNVVSGASTATNYDGALPTNSDTSGTGTADIYGLHLDGGAISATASSATINKRYVYIEPSTDVSFSGTPTVNVDVIYCKAGSHLFLGGGTQVYHGLNILCAWDNYLDGNVYIGSEAGFTSSPAEGDGMLLVLDDIETQGSLFAAGAGIGEFTPLGTVHIKSGDASGHGTPSTNADELIIEGTSPGMTFLGSATSTQYIYFGDSSATVGFFSYDHNDNSMEWQVGSTILQRLDATACKVADDLWVHLQSEMGTTARGINIHGETFSGTQYIRGHAGTGGTFYIEGYHTGEGQTTARILLDPPNDRIEFQAASGASASASILEVNPTDVTVNQDGGDVDLVIEDDAGVVRFRQDAALSATHLLGGLTGNWTEAASPYTVLEDDMYLHCTTKATATVNLPSAPTDGRTLVVKDETGTAGTNNITINRGGSDTIEGATTDTINTNYGYRVYVYRSSVAKWLVISKG